MDRIKIEDFKGLYTNVDKGQLSPEFQSVAKNIRIRTGLLESFGYSKILSDLVDDNDNIIYFAPVILDEDRLKNIVSENDKLINDYKQNLKEYLMIVKSVDATHSSIEFKDLEYSEVITLQKVSSYLFYLINPVDTIISTPNIIFEWYDDNNSSLGYQIQLSKAGGDNFMNPENLIFDIYRNSTDPSNHNTYLFEDADLLENGVIYYWRIGRRYNYDFEFIEESFIYNSEYVTPSVLPPILSYPYGNNVPTPVIFKWFTAENNLGYLLQVATDVNFNNKVLDIVIEQNLVSYTSDLIGETVYYWRMATIGADGNSIWSNTIQIVTVGGAVPNTEIYEFSKVLNHWNSKGKIILLTDNGTFWIGKLNRIMAYSGNQINELKAYNLVGNIYKSSILNIESDNYDNEFIEVIVRIDKIEEPMTYDLTGFGGGIIECIGYTLGVYYKNGGLQGTYRIVEERGWNTYSDYKIRATDYFPVSGWPFKLYSYDYQTFRQNVKFDGNYLPISDPTNITVNEVINLENPTGKLIIDSTQKFIENEIEFIITYTYNTIDEYVTGSFTYTHDGTPASYVLKLSNFIFEKINSNGFDNRITSVQLYARFDKNADYEQLKLWNINGDKVNTDLFRAPLFLSKYDFNGYFLLQTIGTFYNKETYKPITDFDDYLEIRGVAYALKDQNVYSPAIGKGTVMNAVFYQSIPDVEGKFLLDINGYLGVIDKELNIIGVEDSKEGYFLFAFKDKMDLNSISRYSFSSSAEGSIILNKRGIFATNGNDKKLISEQINDIVERNYKTASVFYNPNDSLLYLLTDEGTFILDLIYNYWMELTPKLEGLLSFDESNNIYLLKDKKLYELTVTQNVLSEIETPLFNLEELNLAKTLLATIFEFKGNLQYQLNKKEVSLRKSDRTTINFPVSIANRELKNKFNINFKFQGEIYSIGIDFDIIGEFKSTDFNKQ